MASSYLWLAVSITVAVCLVGFSASQDSTTQSSSRQTTSKVDGSQGYGTGHCELCGNNTMGKEREEVATCFLPAGTVADNNNLNDTVFECACKGNYSGTGIFCEDRDECSLGEDWCDNHADCKNTDGFFFCTCNKGYNTTDSGKTCFDVDECHMDPFICGGTSDNGTFGTCKNTTASYDCTCKDGYTMSTRNVTYNNTDQAPYMMEGPTCVDIDECSNSSLHNCTYDHGLCNDVPGKFYCTCEEGYKFNDDETACVDINECEENGTDTGICGSNAFCKNVDGDEGKYTCGCMKGFKSNSTDTQKHTDCFNIDECTDNDYIFNCNQSHRSICKDVTPTKANETGYRCECDAGYYLDNGLCIDFDECADEKEYECDPNAKCNNLKPYYNCTCNPGYTGNGTNCSDMDECLSKPCADKAICKNLPGNFSCECILGYTGNGTTCTVDGKPLSVLKQNSTKISDYLLRVELMREKLENEQLVYQLDIAKRNCALEKLKEDPRSKRNVLSPYYPATRQEDIQEEIVKLHSANSQLKLAILVEKKSCGLP